MRKEYDYIWNILSTAILSPKNLIQGHLNTSCQVSVHAYVWQSIYSNIFNRFLVIVLVQSQHNLCSITECNHSNVGTIIIYVHLVYNTPEEILKGWPFILVSWIQY